MGSSASSSGTSSGMEAEARRVDTTPRSGLGNLWYSLTSNDPGNVARNRAAAARYAAMPSYTRDSGSSGGIFGSATPRNRTTPSGGPGGRRDRNEVVTPTEPPFGSPTTPMAPSEVATPIYGLPGILPQVMPYGAAYSSLGYGPQFMANNYTPQFPTANYADIFALPADLSFMYR